MSTKLPEGTPKGKGKKEEEPAEFFQPKKLKESTQCFVDMDVHFDKGTCNFKGEFAAPVQKKVHLVTLPTNFQTIKKDESIWKCTSDWAYKATSNYCPVE